MRRMVPRKHRRLGLLPDFLLGICSERCLYREARQDSPFGLIRQLYESYLAGASLWGVTLGVWLGGCSPRSRRREEILGTAPSEHIRVAITALQVSIPITEHPTCLLSESQRRRKKRNDSHMYSLQYYRFLIDQQGFLRVTSRKQVCQHITDFVFLLSSSCQRVLSVYVLVLFAQTITHVFFPVILRLTFMNIQAIHVVLSCDQHRAAPEPQAMRTALVSSK